MKRARDKSSRPAAAATTAWASRAAASPNSTQPASDRRGEDKHPTASAHDRRPRRRSSGGPRAGQRLRRRRKQAAESAPMSGDGIGKAIRKARRRRARGRGTGSRRSGSCGGDHHTQEARSQRQRQGPAMTLSARTQSSGHAASFRVVTMSGGLGSSWWSTGVLARLEAAARSRFPAPGRGGIAPATESRPEQGAPKAGGQIKS